MVRVGSSQQLQGFRDETAGGKNEGPKHKAFGMELVVSTPRGPIRFSPLGAVLQQTGAVLDRCAVLLLVSAALGDHQRNPDGHRLFRDRVKRRPPHSKKS